jgi:Fic family protein
MTRSTGTYETSTVAGEEVRAYIPGPLPPTDPPLDLAKVAVDLAAAEEALRRLEVAGAMVPSVNWFVYAFVRKEAVLTSQIEGTQSTLIDLFKSEADTRNAPGADLEEVCCYLDAVRFAWGQVESDEGLPLSMRLLRETHARLLKSARGASKQPGEIRRSQNWIGGTRPGNAAFVPPPAHRLPELLGDFESWIHAPSELPPLVRIGLLHVQFETLHPFLDGNGRLGRLLIALLLCEWSLLSRPLLYISLFFKTHRAEYYRRLDAVRTEGDWEGWLAYFLEAVAETAEAATRAATELHQIVSVCRAKLHARPGTTVLSLRLFELLPEHPVLTVNTAMDLLGCTRPAAIKALGVLDKAGFMMPLDKRGKGAMLGFEPYLDVLREGTDLGA